jgi:hypothetical protein
LQRALISRVMEMEEIVECMLAKMDATQERLDANTKTM